MKKLPVSLRFGGWPAAFFFRFFNPTSTPVQRSFNIEMI